MNLKNITIGATALASLFFGGCVLGGDDDEVSIELAGDNAKTVPAGQNIPLDGSIKGDGALTVTYAITSSIANVDLTKVTTSANGAGDKKSVDIKDDLALTIKTDVMACTGDYTLKITAKAGSVESTKSHAFSVTNGKDCSQAAGTTVTSSTVQVGAQGHATLGTAVDLDNISVHLSASAKANQAEMDIVIVSALGGTKLRVMSPKEAKTDDFAYVSSWTTLNDTKMYMVTTDYASISTQEAINALWDDSKVLANSQIDISNGTTILAKTNKGKVVLIKIESVSDQSSKAVISVKGYK